MIFNIVGILIGALIAGGAGFYLVKGEKDAESKKINTIGLIAGLAILAFGYSSLKAFRSCAYRNSLLHILYMR